MVFGATAKRGDPVDGWDQGRMSDTGNGAKFETEGLQITDVIN